MALNTKGRTKQDPRKKAFIGCGRGECEGLRGEVTWEGKEIGSEGKTLTGYEGPEEANRLKAYFELRQTTLKTGRWVKFLDESLDGKHVPGKKETIAKKKFIQKQNT